jgi:hypothetical protein
MMSLRVFTSGGEMRIETRALVASAALAWALLPSCGGDSAKCTGAEHCACYGNGTCNAGLDCRSQLCINLNSTGFERDASGAGGAGGGVDTDACLACAQSACTSESNACKAATGCEDIIQCMVKCGKDAVCLSKCNSNASLDANTRSLALQTCAFSRCTSECLYSGSAGAGGAGASGNTGSGGERGAGTGGRGASAGADTGGRAGASGTTGTGGSGMPELTSGINWLGVSADAAPPAMGPNGKLGINGVFYTYGDGCATISWDAPTRCISGELCLASATNWGVSIGFDFDNTGEDGTPPNTKLAWNATSVGVTGFAWETRSPITYSFQFWVQNMDPTWNGKCSAAECSINGPPDGTSSASQDSRLSFSEMLKDNWGGTGTPYAFNATDISSLQFKIPAATDSLSTTYELCIDRLGVIR